MTNEEIIEHARWVYDETLWFHEGIIINTEAQDKAFRAAIEAALNKAHRGFIAGVRDDILDKAEELDIDEDSDLVDDGPAALLSYAKLLDDTLPPEQRLENDGNHI